MVKFRHQNHFVMVRKIMFWLNIPTFCGTVPVKNAVMAQYKTTTFCDTIPSEGRRKKPPKQTCLGVKKPLETATGPAKKRSRFSG